MYPKEEGGGVSEREHSAFVLVSRIDRGDWMALGKRSGTHAQSPSAPHILMISLEGCRCFKMHTEMT